MRRFLRARVDGLVPGDADVRRHPVDAHFEGRTGAEEAAKSIINS